MQNTEFKAKKEVVLVIFGLSIVIGTFAGLSYALSTDKATRVKYMQTQKAKIRDFVAPIVTITPEKPEVEEVVITPDTNIEDLRAVMAFDIVILKHINPVRGDEIVEEILKHSQTHGTDPKLVYSVLFTESLFRNNVRHEPTYVKQLKKKIQAKGMGGVVWEFWDTYLIENTSLTKKADLKDWRKNIEATAAILGYLSNYKMHPQAETTIESAAIRYYGLPNADYIEKINKVYARL